MKQEGVLVAFLGLLGCASSARILGLFPYKGATHFYVIQPLLEELASRGHELLVVSHNPRSEPKPNYTDLSIAYGDDPNMMFLDFNSFEKKKPTFFSNLWGSRKLQSLLALTKGYERAHSLSEVLSLANSTFDLVITEMFNSDVFYGLVYKIGAPVVAFGSCHIFPWNEDTMGAPALPSYLPNVIGSWGPKLGFLDRLRNTIEIWIARAFYRLVVHPKAQATAEKFLGPLPDLADIAANTSLFLVNSYFTLLGHRPFPPSVVEVGGLNVRTPKPLPMDLEKVFNKSKGVIYFSMGSILKGYTLPKEKEAMFISALSASGRTVLWKWESNISSRHPNIISGRWFPQGDILAHPKTELFIGHCGLLGLNEAVVRGVPVICIPIYGDQPTNSEYVREHGIGLVLDYWSLTEEKIRWAINEILYTSKYKENMRKLSSAYNDRPMSAVNTSVYWVEYILKHGPDALRSPHSQMPIWKREGLDIAVVLLSVFAALLVALVYITAWSFRGFKQLVKLAEIYFKVKEKKC
uniref:UDP-glucuronosyltransferase n=1 Tax=Riptortus pedestris TaxID=329032 RepID=R4WDE8_RIPPE|nr:glucosyl/glucuronosyl transferases [Riptortus pedestris]